MGGPPGARQAARVLVVDGDERLLLLKGVTPVTAEVFWVAPGGGLHAGESFGDAAVRELGEETGLRLELGPCVWTRVHDIPVGWDGRPIVLYERFFVARTTRKDLSVRPQNRDSYVVDHRWWTLPEMEASTETLVPRRLPVIVPPILRGEYPDTPFDCGV